MIIICQFKLINDASNDTNGSLKRSMHFYLQSLENTVHTILCQNRLQRTAQE